MGKHGFGRQPPGLAASGAGAICFFLMPQKNRQKFDHDQVRRARRPVWLH
jgi:hypothetical protein